jgi:hypothetical protein
MKKNKIVMLGVAALFSSTLFTQAAFAKSDEFEGAYVAPSVFQLQGYTVQPKPVLPHTSFPVAPVEKEDSKK